MTYCCSFQTMVSASHGQKRSYVTYSFRIGWLTVLDTHPFSVRLHNIHISRQKKNIYISTGVVSPPFFCGLLKCSQARLPKQRKQRTLQELQDLGIVSRWQEYTRHPNCQKSVIDRCLWDLKFLNVCYRHRKADQSYTLNNKRPLHGKKKRKKKTFENRLQLKISNPSALPKHLRVFDFNSGK